MNKIILSIFLLLLIIGCSQQKNTNVISITNSSGEIHKITHEGRIVAVLSIDNNGNIISVTNPVDSMDQVVSYHPDSQFILGKALQDSSRKQQGVAYFFNKENELLYGAFQYKNDIRTKDGFSFHDGMNTVKEYMIFDSMGTVIYRRTYDKFGKHLVTEGNYPPD